MKKIYSGSGSEITLLACGDMLFADFYFNIGYGIGSYIDHYGSENIFNRVRPILKKGDLLIGNLESPISNESANDGIHRKEFLASPIIAKTLFLEGFRVINISNNHISQHGLSAFEDTIANLRKNSVSPIGRINSGNKNQELVIKKIKEKNLGFLSYSLIEDHFEQSPSYYAHNPSINEIIDHIEESKSKCDFIIIMLHWGDEFIDRPSSSQITLAHQLIDAGCDVIIGGHSHIFQGVEKYKGKIIAYSLGNFVFSMPWKPTRATGLLNIQLNEERNHSFSIVPIWIDDYFKPVIPKNKEKQYVESHLTKVQHLIYNQGYSKIEYKKELKKNLKRYRFATWINFLQNFPRMPLSTSLKLISEFIERRMGKSK